MIFFDFFAFYTEETMFLINTPLINTNAPLSVVIDCEVTFDTGKATAP